MKRHRGFTLIELMIAVAVVATLAAIAWPGYSATIHRAHRSDARLALLRIQHLQERHYGRYLRYAARLGSPEDPGTLEMDNQSDAGHYTLSLSAGALGQDYLATATARIPGRQADDLVCRQLSVDESGRRLSADAAGNWIESDPHRCWN